MASWKHNHILHLWPKAHNEKHSWMIQYASAQAQDFWLQIRIIADTRWHTKFKDKTDEEKNRFQNDNGFMFFTRKAHRLGKMKHVPCYLQEAMLSQSLPDIDEKMENIFADTKGNVALCHAVQLPYTLSEGKRIILHEYRPVMQWPDYETTGDTKYLFTRKSIVSNTQSLIYRSYTNITRYSVIRMAAYGYPNSVGNSVIMHPKIYSKFSSFPKMIRISSSVSQHMLL